MGFVVDKAALRQVILLVLRLFPISIIPPLLYTHFFITHVGLSQESTKSLGNTQMKKWLIAGLSRKRFSFLKHLDQKDSCITNPIPAMEAQHWNIDIAAHLNLIPIWR